MWEDSKASRGDKAKTTNINRLTSREKLTYYKTMATKEKKKVL